MESPYCAREQLLLLTVLPLFPIICVTLLSCYLAHNKILFHRLSSTELCYHPYVIVHTLLSMLSSIISSIRYHPQSYVIVHMLSSMLSSTELCYCPCYCPSYRPCYCPELCIRPCVIVHVIVHRAMLSSTLSSICCRPCYRPQSYVIVHMLSS